MKRRMGFVTMMLAALLSLAQIIGIAMPVNAAGVKTCSHGYILAGDIGIRLHECGDSVCITCYHGKSKRVVIPATFKLYGKTLAPSQFDSDDGFSKNGVKEIVLPDTVESMGYWDEEDCEDGDIGYRGITFYVHKGSKAEQAVKRNNPYKYIKDTPKPQPVKGTTIKRTVRIEKMAKVTWKKVKCSKYEIRYSLKKNMKNSKKVTCKKNKTSLVIKKLKKNRKYYVQIRVKVGKKYSAWSKVKTIAKR